MAEQDSRQSQKENSYQTTGHSRERLSVEQKLQLSHILRQEQDYNRLQMDEREMLVYGASRKRSRRRGADYGGSKAAGYYKSGREGMLQAAEEEAAREEAWEREQKRNRISFMIRGFTAILLFTIILLMRFENLSIGGIDYQNLISSLQSREFINGVSFDELMPEEEGTQEQPEENNKDE